MQMTVVPYILYSTPFLLNRTALTPGSVADVGIVCPVAGNRAVFRDTLQAENGKGDHNVVLVWQQTAEHCSQLFQRQKSMAEAISGINDTMKTMKAEPW